MSPSSSPKPSTNSALQRFFPHLFPSSLPKPSTNSALQRLTITSPKPQNPHTILSLPHAPPHTIFASQKAKSAMFTNTMLFNSACETETSRRRRLYAENSHSEYIAETHTNEKEIERIAENSLLMPLMRDAWVDGIPAPSTLWHGLWNEGEIACLFGDPNIGKSLLANQIANEAAAMGHQVLYVDFENPDIHFHSRYTSKEETFVGNYGNIHYVGLRFDTAHSASYTIEQKFQAIQDAILVHRTPVVIIDDISHILPAKFSERSQSILHQLRHLAQNWHVAILVLAHTRYHRPDTPLSITHLAGSREFSFAFDSIFALGKVTNELPATDGEALVPTHYIRQFKARAAAITYDDATAPKQTPRHGTRIPNHRQLRHRSPTHHALTTLSRQRNPHPNSSTPHSRAIHSSNSHSTQHIPIIRVSHHFTTSRTHRAHEIFHRSKFKFHHRKCFRCFGCFKCFKCSFSSNHPSGRYFRDANLSNHQSTKRNGSRYWHTHPCHTIHPRQFSIQGSVPAPRNLQSPPFLFRLPTLL